ncbi:PilZ domain-containing protein [uncultured Hoeflea sp.]|uniref:PilZ domain-containing protein n=1 Tax=uncultured Hoeflea sp. TaxID=538666 RepID=UPI0030EC4DE9|tara:strand:- start:121186 stop:121503 length:318 start_codon:yes stop_codon:yes gene_type:complete
MKNFTGRAQPRNKTRMRAKIDCKGNETPGSVLDLSRLGAGLYLSRDIPVAFGDEIHFKTEEMGHLTGTVRWSRSPRVGVSLVLSSNTEAKVESYYKMLQEGKSPG